MKRNIILLVTLLMVSCQDITIGYLKTDNATYGIPFEIRKTPDPELDKMRILYNADWVSKPMAGVVGTPPINYEIIDITSADGDATLLKQEIEMRGGGICYVPIDQKSPKGTYLVSVKITNEGYSATKKDVLTIIIK